MKAIVATSAAVVFLVGCSPKGSAPRYEQRSERSSPRKPSYESMPQRQSARSDTARSDTFQRTETGKLEFLNKIREADPQHRTIDRALMNDRDELGIVLSRNVAMDDIPKLMRSLLKQMAGEFPGEDLTIVAYAPNQPPMKIGTARLDANSREMTYTPAQQNYNRR